jgi:hypothetical protein
MFNRNWVDTRWQQYITHLHANSTHNTEKGNLESAGRARLCELYPGICLTTEGKERKTSVRVACITKRRNKILLGAADTDCPTCAHNTPNLSNPRFSNS